MLKKPTRLVCTFKSCIQTMLTYSYRLFGSVYRAVSEIIMTDATFDTSLSSTMRKCFYCFMINIYLLMSSLQHWYVVKADYSTFLLTLDQVSVTL